MKKGWLTLILSLCILVAFAQDVNEISKRSRLSTERFPVFPDCENFDAATLENCFYKQINDLVFKNFVVPEDLVQNNFQGTVKVLFEVDRNGVFKVIYVNAINEPLIKEAKRVFVKFPKIKPATYNGNPTFSQYNITISIPLKSADQMSSAATVAAEVLKTDSKLKPLTELDSIVYKKFNNPQLNSNLNVPFSHSYYSRFDPAMNQVGANNHTASKPYTYVEVAKYYSIADQNEKIKKNKSSWWGRKLWNENLVEVQGEDYWFVINPIFDLQVGTASGNRQVNTFINTRAINFSGGLGKQLNFTTTIFESQGRFADYFNQYINYLEPTNGVPIVPGIGIAKDFKTDAYDFPSADANLTFTPSKFIDLQLGYGRNFIGDGYRSLFASDGASPSPYFKINTNFWKIKYTNTYMWLKDVRPEVTVERTYATKYMANHYLSLNVTNRWNLGLFESVIWTDTNNRGFDIHFVNPIIFYRSVEFAASARSGNAVLGLSSKYKWNNDILFYGQFLLDEFSLGEVKGENNSWKNKFAYQLGVKYFNAFKVQNLSLQLEYNHVRPYVYSHSMPITNYGHNNQNIGHPWGSNFSELLVIGRYQQGRLYADAKITLGTRGFDFTTSGANSNYGGNIYRDYDLDRYANSGVTVGQGNKTNIFIADLQAGYVVNPMTNMKLFGSFIYRNFNPNQNTVSVFNESTTWFSFGIRSDVFNMYFDY